jgi:hypothetical protein
MAPYIDSLQKTFGDQILILQVAYERAEAIAPVVAAMQKVKPFQLPGVTSDTVLNHLFPHHSLPHFVWIDRSGTVRAITEEKEVNAANISRMLQGGEQASPKLAVKQDIVLPYEKQQPLFIGGNGINAWDRNQRSSTIRCFPGMRPACWPAWISSRRTVTAASAPISATCRSPGYSAWPTVTRTAGSPARACACSPPTRLT